MGVNFYWGHVCRGNELWVEVSYMGSSGNRDRHLASRSVLNEFTDDAFIITPSSLFQNGPA